MSVIIRHPDQLKMLHAAFKHDGLQQLHVLSDFDRTLTYAAVDGVSTPSMIALLRDGQHLTPEYAAKAQALFEEYRPIEIDPTIPIAQKKIAMESWWQEHYQLLLASDLHQSDIEDIVASKKVQFRDGVPELLDFLHQHDIPLVIFSASGCGEAVQLMFKQIGKDYPNIHYLTNQFEWDADGKAVSVKEPVIHSLNKDVTLIEQYPTIFSAIQNRTNVLLLGDSLSDLGMVDGFVYKNLVSVGFLNADYDLLRAEYEKKFDVVLEGDGDVEFLNRWLRELE